MPLRRCKFNTLTKYQQSFYVMKKYFRTSTVSGYRKVLAKRGILYNLFWITIILVTFGMFTFHFWRVFDAFRKRVVGTEFHYGELNPDPLSATFCFNIPYELLKTRENPRIPMYTNATVTTTFDEFFTFSNQIWMEAFGNKTLDEVSGFSRSLSKQSFWPYAFTNNFFLGKWNVLVNCINSDQNQKDRSCQANIQEIIRPDKGICLMYNLSPNVSTRPRETTFTYLTAASALEKANFFLDKSELFVVVGVHVNVHERNTYPDFRENSFEFSAGTRTLAKLTSSVMAAEPLAGDISDNDPNCRDGQENLRIYEPGWTFGFKRSPGMIREYAYTAEACMSLNIQRMIYNKCGCLSEKYPVPEDLATKAVNFLCHQIPEKILISKITNSSAIIDDELAGMYYRHNCETNIIKSIVSVGGNWSGLRPCLNRCRQRTINFNNIQMDWPSAKMTDTFANKLTVDLTNRATEHNESYPNSMTSNFFFFYLIRAVFTPINYRPYHFAQIVFISNNRNETLLEEQFTYPLEQLISQFCSIIGLWTGVGFISIVEAIVVSIEIILVLFGVHWLNNSSVVMDAI